ncbi:hypothetical protein [Cryptosporangium sp. NPDC051539]|uniref:hypothetical protein n=1 Tax=Cryptosporangium sp. NPDC051539 TaxID=3363962 RepID=UPI0037A1434B
MVLEAAALKPSSVGRSGAGPTVPRLRLGVTGLVALVMALAALTSVAGCASAEPSASPGELFQEYLQASEVRHDRLPRAGDSSADRLANFLSMGTPDQLAGALMRTYDCGEGDSSSATAPNPCDLSGPVGRAATGFAGAGAKPLGRSLLVKHDDGTLELVTVYVVRKAGGAARLIDQNGDTYTDLEDFRSRNDVLDHDDTVLTLRDVTSVPGAGDLVVVSGHTAAVWPWWLAGGVAALVLAGAVSVVVRRRRAARYPDPLLTPLVFRDPLESEQDGIV